MRLRLISSEKKLSKNPRVFGKEGALLSLGAVVALLLASTGCGQVAERGPIKVGVLHSLSGTMAASETPVKDATLLAIAEINARGGLLGRKIEPVVVDGGSEAARFAAGAERLINKEKVSAVFGCWTSSSRKNVKPLFEKYDHLLIYPVQHEGLEQSPNIVYTGAAPNQQIIPAVKWCFDRGWRRIFLVGSDYVFPRTANEIIKTQVKALGGEVLGEEYLLLGAKEASVSVAKIAAVKPDVILNTLKGDTNASFFHALRQAGVTPDKIPTVSFSVGEEELRNMSPKEVAGDYAAASYFQSIVSEENQIFVNAFKKKYGPERVTDDPIEAGYFGVYLWAQAVMEAGTDEVSAVRKAIRNQSFPAPEGIVYVDPETLHTWKTVRIGIVKEDGQFLTVWTSGKPIRPVPYPSGKLKGEWEQFIADLYMGWGQQWENSRR